MSNRSALSSRQSPRGATEQLIVEVELMQRARLVPRQEGQGGVMGWGHGDSWSAVACVCVFEVVLWLFGESE